MVDASTLDTEGDRPMSSSDTAIILTAPGEAVFISLEHVSDYSNDYSPEVI